MFEIERRFLCGTVDEEVLAVAPSWRITQGYITDSGPTVRIRRRDDDFILTIKKGSGLVRREIEIPIPPGPGDELLELAGEHMLEKTRYRLGRWEIDLFHGKLAGLILAEVELESEDEETPSAPAGVELIREVTMEPAFSNYSLASLGEVKARRFVEWVTSQR